MNITKSVFILLSKAVLSGEYIFDPNYRKALDAFEADIAMEIGNIDTYFTQRFSDLSLGLKCILKHYVGFLINIEDKIKNSDEEFFFSAFKSDDKNINNEFLSDFISIVLKLASIDHFLIADNDNREILVILREELENRKKVENKDLKDIYSALLDKCNLLLVKMFYDPIIGRNYSLNFKSILLMKLSFQKVLSRKPSTDIISCLIQVSIKDYTKNRLRNIKKNVLAGTPKHLN